MVRLVAGVPCSNDEFSQPLPQFRFDGSVVLTPLVCTIKNFAVHVVLNLFSRGVPPTDGQRAPVPGIAVVLALFWRDVPPNIVKNVRPFSSLNRIENPFQKSSGFARKAGPVQGVDRKCRIANPVISVIPVPA